ncbi:MAG TPA: DUF3455 domain-containing protein, partial [Polyangia bacterium]|nr:DUF3455 domain-containing protein [Polyangia bacterium]
MTKGVVAKVVLALSSAVLVAAAGCGGTSGGAGLAGHGGGGEGGTSGGVGGASSAGAGGATAGVGGTAGAAGSVAGNDGGVAGSDGGAGAAGSAAGSDGGAGSDGSVAAPFEPVPIPPALAVPTGATLKFRAHGRGTQNYACVATTAPATDGGTADGGADAGVTTYAWGPATPAANLYDETNTQIGTHFAGPTWMSSVDGSDAVGSKVASVASTETNAIPWLLLKVTEHMGSGVFMDVTYVQRLDTANGVAPATGCDAATVNTTVAVDYTADYYFYTGGVTATDAGVAPTWPFATVTIPDGLATPAGATLKLRLHGWGAQIYTCTQTGGADGGVDAGATTYAWGPATPSAKLYDDANMLQGMHSA